MLIKHYCLKHVARYRKLFCDVESCPVDKRTSVDKEQGINICCHSHSHVAL